MCGALRGAALSVRASRSAVLHVVPGDDPRERLDVDENPVGAERAAILVELGLE